MSAFMSRRAWLKTSTILTGGLTFLSAGANTILPPRISSAPRQKFISDAEFAKFAPPELKARLFANENPFGPSEKAKKAITDSLSTSYQYPFMFMQELQDKITAYEGLGKDMVMMSAGSSALLHATALYFGKEGGSIITGDPSYDDLPERAAQYNMKWVKVPLTPDYKLDLDAMEKAVDSTTRLVYVCNPNNPTGTFLDVAKLKDFCERVSKKVTVFVDEAYIDYTSNPKANSLIESVKKGQNLIVARTFSKLYGFAGLRVGYMIAQPEMLKKMEPFSSGLWCLTATSIRAALASYQDREFLDGALQKTLASKVYLYKILKEEGYEYIPSSTNFVLFPIKMDGERFSEEMMKRGVGVRHWKFNDQNWCRVSLGRMDEMQAFATAFKEIS